MTPAPAGESLRDGIVAAILLPVFARVRAKARQAVCLSNKRQIAAAVLMCMREDDETFPFVLDVAENCIDAANVGDNNKAWKFGL